MGLFNPYAIFLADVNLLLQMVILAVLLAGFLLVKFKRSFMKHGVTMLAALVLHTVLIFGIMVPSLLSMEEAGLLTNLSDRLAFFTIPHAILGSIVEIMAIYFVGTFLFNRGDVKSCLKNKRLMQVTIILWFLEIILGVYIYVLLYVPL